MIVWHAKMLFLAIWPWWSRMVRCGYESGACKASAPIATGYCWRHRQPVVTRARFRVRMIWRWLFGMNDCLPAAPRRKAVR